ncbi:MAG: hypothetical protein RJA81_1606 [Planctomycetota bacterium]|jgi:hypothetical protein
MHLIETLLSAIKKFLLGVVELTRKVLLGFVAAVLAGVGMAVIAATVVALIAALALSGIRVRNDESDEQPEETVIDVTPALA